jgi:TetR/AcrR family transcriptional repressor of lmrAB and yxaGH operons
MEKNMTSTRDQIIQTTSELLENQGYHATGMNEIVKESGAPKGSIYYYFPDGKEGITAEAVMFAGKMVSERVKIHLAKFDDPAESIRSFIETIAHFVEESGFKSGGPLTIVSSETATTSEKLNLVCREAYGMVRMAFQDKLKACGFSEEKAENLAWVIVSAIEGGVILSRTYHTGEPLRKVARELAVIVKNQ